MSIPTLVLAAALLAVLVSNGFLTVVLLVARRGSPTSPKSCGPASGAPDIAPAVALIRPIRGLEPGAEIANRSLLHQTYHGGLQVLFASTSRDDPGLALARAHHEHDPGVSCLVAGSAPDAFSDKARNMIAGWRATSAPFVAFCDADISLAPDTIARCRARFDTPEVGAVFAPVLHVGHDVPGRLTMQLSTGDKLAIARAYDRFGALNFLEGGLMVLRRTAVEQAGGIDAVAGALADDLRLAGMLRRQGFSLRAGPVITHDIPAAGLAAWARQYHRWMVCQRAENPGLLWPQILLHPLGLPFAACVAAPSMVLPWALLLASVAWRVALTTAMDHALTRPEGVRFGWWAAARPLADLLHLSVCVAAYLLPVVRWRGRTYRIGRGGQVEEVVRTSARRDVSVPVLDQKKS